MNAITLIEQALVDKVKTVLGFPNAPVVKKVETLPGGWTQVMLARALQLSPSVHIAFLGGQSDSSGGYINARFAVYIISKSVREEDRRRGNAREIGAYEIIDLLATHLDMFSIDDIGTLLVRGVENVFSDAAFDIGGAIYAMTLEVPNLPWSEKNSAALAPFLTFEGTHSLAAGMDEPAHQTQITLEQ